MIPSRFISLTSFPLTDNAKVDVTKLRGMVNTRLNGDEGDRDDKSPFHQRFREVLKVKPMEGINRIEYLSIPRESDFVSSRWTIISSRLEDSQ